MAQGDIMMALGDYRFSVATAAYQTLERVSRYRWGSHKQFGTRPKLQFVGPDTDTINLKGVIYPHFKGGVGQIDAMRVEAEKGLPLAMRASTGKSLGYWCIEEIREVQSHLVSDAPMKQEFNLRLLYHGDKL